MNDEVKKEEEKKLSGFSVDISENGGFSVRLHYRGGSETPWGYTDPLYVYNSINKMFKDLKDTLS